MAESALFLPLVLLAASLLGSGIGYLLARLQCPPVKPKPLDCGCPRDGRPEYGCLTCGFTRCPEHVDITHTCFGPCPECWRLHRGSPSMWSVETHARWHVETGAPPVPLY